MNRKKAYLSFLLAFLILISGIQLAPVVAGITYKDFYVLTGKKTPFGRNLSLRDAEDLKFFKKTYLANYSEKAKEKKGVTIPKVIHYIWLGPKEFPSKSIDYITSWVQHHPDWSFIFWTDDQERTVPHPKMEKRLISDLASPFLSTYYERSDNFGEKSDLIRYEILYRQGGLYVDHDIECYQSFSSFASSVDFFAGLEPMYKDIGIDTRVFPSNALIGTRPFHPVLLKTIELVEDRWKEVDDAFPGKDARSCTLKVLHRTLYSFMLATKEGVNLHGNKDVIFPASFFYPDRITTKKTFDLWRSKNLIWASHKSVGIWKPKNDQPIPINEVAVLKAKNKALMKKYKNAKILLYCNFLACGVCLYFILKGFFVRKGSGFSR